MSGNGCPNEFLGMSLAGMLLWLVCMAEVRARPDQHCCILRKV